MASLSNLFRYSESNVPKKAAETVVDYTGFLIGMWYALTGRPGEAYQAQVVDPILQNEANDLVWRLVESYAMVAWSFAATGLILLGGKSIGGVFSGVGIYAP